MLYKKNVIEKLKVEVNYKHLWESAGVERFIVYGFFNVLCVMQSFFSFLNGRDLVGLLGSLLVLSPVLNDLRD